MPAKNSTKIYLENSYYHLYNRGVEKRKIFGEGKDYGVFLGYLKEYLIPKDEVDLRDRLHSPSTNYQEKDKILKALRLNNFYQNISLLSYCLMPNHFHLLIKQKESNSIDAFMNSLCTRYSLYFNRKYKRVGPLYQGVYKAVLVSSEEQLLHLSRYIHSQSLASQGVALRGGETKQPSSYPEYLGLRNTRWIRTEEILNFFNQTNPRLNYDSFVRGEISWEIISKIAIDLGLH